MNKTVRAVASFVLVVMLVLLAAHSLGARQAGQDDVRLKAAMKKETVDGDLRGAIAQYQQLAQSSNRVVAAKALVGMGRCYDKLGAEQTKEAQKAYERVVAQFADQVEAVATARARLAALAPPAARPAAGPSNRMVWKAPNNSTDPRLSSDGRFLAWTGEDTSGGCRLTVQDLSTGAERAGTCSWVDVSYVLSSDGKRYAHDWHGKAQQGVSIGELSGSTPATERRIPLNFKWIELWDWSRDGRWIAAVVPSGNRALNLVVISTQDGTVRTVPTELPWFVAHFKFSPDGRHLAYDAYAPGATTRDIHVLRLADGIDVTAGWSHRGDEGLVGWTSDGGRVLFTSDRQGTNGFWAQRFVNGKIQGDPDLLKPDVGELKPLGVSASGAVYYVVDSNWIRPDVRVGAFDFAAGRWNSEPVDAIPEHIRGVQPAAVPSPTWSPDGTNFLYLMGTGPSQFMTQVRIVMRSLDASKPTIVEPRLPILIAPVIWSPDAKSLVAAGRALDGRWGIWRINPLTGDIDPLAAPPDSSVIYVRRWSKDGSRLYFERNVADYQRGIFEKNVMSGTERQLFTLDARTHSDVLIAGDGEKIRYRQALVTDEKSGWADRSAGADWAILERDVASGVDREIARGPFQAMSPSPDARSIAVISNDLASSSTLVRLLPLGEGRPRELLRVQLVKSPAPGAAGNSATVSFLRWAPDGGAILVKKRVAADGPVETWWVPVDGRQPQRIDDGSRGEIGSMAVHPDGRQVAFVATKRRPRFPQEVWVWENILPR